MKNINEMNNDELKEEFERMKNMNSFMQKRALIYIKQKMKESHIKNSLTKDIPGTSVKLLIDEKNAILYAEDSPFNDYDTRWTCIVDGKRCNKWFLDKEQAILAWMGRKFQNKNSQFGMLAYRMLKGRTIYDNITSKEE